MSTFTAYFDVADEIANSLWLGLPQTQPSHGTEPLTLADLDPHFTDQARDAADELHLPWPPVLAIAEEFALDHPEVW